MAQEDSDRSLDAVAAFLRVWAQHPFDLPNREAREIARALENWASHLLLGTARPGAASDEAPRGKVGARDWPGVRQFIAALRGEEAAFVRQMLTDFRQTVHGLVTRVRDAIAEERVLDARLVAQLELLRTAAAADDVKALRAAATQVTDALGAVLDAHRVRQAAQEAEMSSRIQALGERLQVAEHLAEEDPLTGLVNRRGFDAELNRSAGLAGQFNVASALLLIDVDRFKQVNDTFGHLGGDAILRATANTLSRTFPRRSDCVARFGGDEFAVILRDTRPGEAARLALRLLDALRSLRVRHDANELNITASIGVAELKAGEPSEAWLARADAAVYAAKSAGRDRVVAG